MRHVGRRVGGGGRGRRDVVALGAPVRPGREVPHVGEGALRGGRVWTPLSEPTITVLTKGVAAAGVVARGQLKARREPTAA